MTDTGCIDFVGGWWTLSSLLRNLDQHAPELSGTLRNLPRPSGTNLFRNLPEPTSGTYASTRQNSPEPSGTRLRNLHQHTPEPFGTFRNPHTPELSRTFRNPRPEPTPAHRNLPEPASGTYTNIRRNPPEPSGTRLRNLHQHTPELSETFRNFPPEPAPATRTSTHRSLSGLKTPLADAVGEKRLKQTQVIWNISTTTCKYVGPVDVNVQPLICLSHHKSPGKNWRT